MRLKALGVVAVVGAGVVLALTCGRRADDRPFDQATWRIARPVTLATEGGPGRFGMVQDLCDRELTAGMSIGEVEDLLGPPDLKYSEPPVMLTYIVDDGNVGVLSPRGHLFLQFDLHGRLERWGFVLA